MDNTSIEIINAAIQSPNNSKSRSILREAQDKGYITEGNKWIIGGLRALHNLSNRNAQSQQGHTAEQEREEKESAALEYIQSLISR